MDVCIDSTYIKLAQPHVHLPACAHNIIHASIHGDRGGDCGGGGDDDEDSKTAMSSSPLSSSSPHQYAERNGGGRKHGQRRHGGRAAGGLRRVPVEARCQRVALGFRQVRARADVQHAVLAVLPAHAAAGLQQVHRFDGAATTGTTSPGRRVAAVVAKQKVAHTGVLPVRLHALIADDDQPARCCHGQDRLAGLLCQAVLDDRIDVRRDLVRCSKRRVQDDVVTESYEVFHLCGWCALQVPPRGADDG